MYSQFSILSGHSFVPGMCFSVFLHPLALLISKALPFPSLHSMSWHDGEQMLWLPSISQPHFHMLIFLSRRQSLLLPSRFSNLSPNSHLLTPRLPHSPTPVLHEKQMLLHQLSCLYISSLTLTSSSHSRSEPLAWFKIRKGGNKEMKKRSILSPFLDSTLSSL